MVNQDPVGEDAVGGGYEVLLGDIIGVLDQARSAAARGVNTLMTTAYWLIGRRIVEHDQAGASRADYGSRLLDRLSADLSGRLGRGFSRRNLQQIRQFYLTWPPDQIRQTLSAESKPVETGLTTSAEPATLAIVPLPAVGDPRWARAFPLSWSAYVRLLTIKDDQARSFYETEALRNGWTVRQLDRQVNAMFYERTALSMDKTAMLRQGADQASSDVLSPQAAFRDPFVLEFLDLKDQYSETDLEDALVNHLADFLMELGDDFAFLARQRRMRIDDTWFRVDLTLFHRTLRCLVLIDLKLGRYSYQDAGQMTLYLNYARHHWTKPGENPPVGLILCAHKGADEARYSLEGLANPVLAAEYKLALPNEATLASELARTRTELEAGAKQGQS